MIDPFPLLTWPPCHPSMPLMGKMPARWIVFLFPAEPEPDEAAARLLCLPPPPWPPAESAGVESERTRRRQRERASASQDGAITDVVVATAAGRDHASPET